MPQWAGSSWYFLRYVDNHNDKELVSREKADKYLPVDMYIGGVEHAVLHLLYSVSIPNSCTISEWSILMNPFTNSLTRV